MLSRNMCIGESAHQKLDLLKGLVQLLGYESIAIFGDCFDEVTLLDPVCNSVFVECKNCCTL